MAPGTAEIFPALVLSGSLWHYDYQKALAMSDRMGEQAALLRSYDCHTRTFYSLRAIGNRTSSQEPPLPEKPNEDFDLAVSYSPMMVSVHLHHPRKGASVLYREVDRIAFVHPFPFLPLSLALSPHNSLILSRFGHSIDHSDFRSFYHRVFRPACLTHSCLYLGSGSFRGRPVDLINIAPDQLEARPIFGRMWLILDSGTGLMVSVATQGSDGKFWERIDYDNCRLSF